MISYCFCVKVTIASTAHVSHRQEHFECHSDAIDLASYILDNPFGVSRCIGSTPDHSFRMQADYPIFLSGIRSSILLLHPVALLWSFGCTTWRRMKP
ncbi:hypothetical protein AVEN_144630-1 [Araneus ventricosus]|uniref:Uncharacterized protein n=1 Tax=Araneus ventricosus TaxID=182803 RepID=A0A4Y2C0B4_ARAVE|nr:hypothetical protein AVEN_144630-1 [Araneus ventricosus]